MITDDLTVNNNNKWKWFKCSITLTHTHTHMDVYMGIPLPCSIIRATMTGWCTHTHTRTSTPNQQYSILQQNQLSLYSLISQWKQPNPQIKLVIWERESICCLKCETWLNFQKHCQNDSSQWYDLHCVCVFANCICKWSICIVKLIEY